MLTTTHLPPTSYRHSPSHPTVSRPLRPDLHHPISPDDLSSVNCTTSPAADLFSDGHPISSNIDHCTTSLSSLSLSPPSLSSLLTSPGSLLAMPTPPPSSNTDPATMSALVVQSMLNSSSHLSLHPTNAIPPRTVSPLGRRGTPRPGGKCSQPIHSVAPSRPDTATLSSGVVSNYSLFATDSLATASYQSNAADMFLRSGIDEYNNDYDRDFD